MRISGSRWVVAGTVVLVFLVGGLVAWAAVREEPAPARPAEAPVAVVAPAARSVSVTRAVSSLAVLRNWDRSRARAWARGDVGELRGLYVARSDVGARDVAMLRAWSRRGLRVEGMTMQVLAVELRERTSRSLELLVTDRLVGAEAIRGSRGACCGSRDGCCATSSTTDRASRIALPQDQPTSRVLVFRKVDGRWLLASAVAA